MRKEWHEIKAASEAISEAVKAVRQAADSIRDARAFASHALDCEDRELSAAEKDALEQLLSLVTPRLQGDFRNAGLDLILAGNKK